MPVERFKNKEAYRKWTAYRHIHGIAAPNLKEVIVGGKRHKVQHGKRGKRRRSSQGRRS
jgi:hypothetical protein